MRLVLQYLSALFVSSALLQASSPSCEESDQSVKPPGRAVLANFSSCLRGPTQSGQLALSTLLLRRAVRVQFVWAFLVLHSSRLSSAVLGVLRIQPRPGPPFDMRSAGCVVFVGFFSLECDSPRILLLVWAQRKQCSAGLISGEVKPVLFQNKTSL